MVTVWIGGLSVAVGALLWAWTIRSFLALPGYGPFDNTAASGFDLGWAKGALFVGVGAGLSFRSWPIGVGAGVVGFLSTMAVKPIVAKVLARRAERTRPPR